MKSAARAATVAIRNAYPRRAGAGRAASSGMFVAAAAKSREVERQKAASLKLIMASLPDLIANHSDPACGRMRSK